MYKYLPQSYVEWRELELIPLKLPRDDRVRVIPDDRCPPHMIYQIHYIEAVELDGAYYCREWDGLCWTRFDVWYPKLLVIV